VVFDVVLNGWVFRMFEHVFGVLVEWQIGIKRIGLYTEGQLNSIDHISVKNFVFFLQLKEFLG
jgi:hypothetical protein